MVTGGAQAGTTYYYNGNDSLDLSYEKTIKANGVTEHKHYISLPGSNGQWLLGQFVQRSGNLAANPASSRAAQELNYFHQDAQGSTVAVSDANGQIQERMAYDPWGDRRSVTGPADPNNLITAEKTDRGYTQHEMLDEVGLVHMNGRIYDPTLGRMLTADILVSYPERSTSFNRYAYALNNPLRFVDPTGWEPHFGDNGYTEEAGRYNPNLKAAAYKQSYDIRGWLDYKIFVPGGPLITAASVNNYPLTQTKIIDETMKLVEQGKLARENIYSLSGTVDINLKVNRFHVKLDAKVDYSLEFDAYIRYTTKVSTPQILSSDLTSYVLQRVVLPTFKTFEGFQSKSKTIEMEDGTLATQIVASTYNNKEIDYWVGSLTVFMQNGKLVGLRDFYDMDSKSEKRSFQAELATRMAHVEGAPGYKICGGKQPKGGC